MNLVAYAMMLWDKSIARKVLFQCLNRLVTRNTVQIRNIICLGHRIMNGNVASIIQHIAAAAIAKELTILYERFERPLATPITIVAQDPGYDIENDGVLLAGFPVPIRIVSDPHGILAIYESSLVMSCYPNFPVKQIVADLAADLPADAGPAAVLWNNSEWDDEHGGVDCVTYSWNEAVYFGNPGSRRMVDMLEGYAMMMDGAELFPGALFRVEDEERRHDELTYEEDIERLVRAANEPLVQDANEVLEEGIKMDSDPNDTTLRSRAFHWIKDMELWARLE